MSQAEFKRRLKALMLRPENQVCSDCPERQPRWASLIVPPPGAPHGTGKIGAFCCLECSGSHRRLGVHISFVRSVNLDQWKEQEVLAMENGGNAKVNAIFEARLSVAKPTQTATGPMRERYIRDKYERRKFYDPNAFASVSQMEAQREQEEVVNGVQKRLTSRQPSEAAKKRAAKSRGSASAVRSTRTVKTPVAAPAPPPAPEPVADLLDFGNFDSFEAAEGVQASVVAASTSPPPAPTAAPPAPQKEPELDLFANMSIGNGGGPGVASNGQMQQSQPQQQAEQKKMSAADIMSMFNVPTGQQHNNPMQQNMFAMNGNGMAGMQNGMGGGMPNGNMNHNNMMGQQQMGMMNNGMNQMGMMNNMNPQQQQMMQMQNNMMMHQGMGGNMNNVGNMGMMGGQQGMGGNNMNMMQGQMQQPQMNNMMMQGGGQGMMQQQGNAFGQQSPMMGQQQQQKQQRGGNQFADFGNFGR